MRGARCTWRTPQAPPGIIPAYAGSTRGLLVCVAPSQDHPRVCGEHSRMETSSRSRSGSSPRMRGARFAGRSDHIAARIIPAYAGSTRHRRDQQQYVKDHPRVCGEHAPSIHSRLNQWGSSPRMRGARRAPRFCVVRIGIIPAYAGSTSSISARSGGAGIIPAYAGSTHWAAWHSTLFGDHPRVCGEHTRSAHMSTSVTGSSPRMRGARPLARTRRRGQGIIPAYAGSTPP